MSRTNTTQLTTFHLPLPTEATFVFSSDLHSVCISIPQGSRWIMHLHWHSNNSSSCISVQCLSGSLRVHRATKQGSDEIHTTPGTEPIQFKPGEMIAWRLARPSNRGACVQDWSVDLVVADQSLYRNICSAVLDRDRYPGLTSTPLWVKLLSSLLRHFPQARERFLTFATWVQLQSILYAHGVREYHGRIDLTWPWFLEPFGSRPPRWVLRLQLETQYAISWLVMSLCYWGGRLLLGIRGQYPEYTPAVDTKQGDDGTGMNGKTAVL